jgi:hypothetical protein
MRRAGLFAGLLTALILGPAARADTAVDYQGLRITVPDGWRVYHLGPKSTECLRFDRHALYLGPGGENQICPAHAVGRTEAIHVEPLTEQTASFLSGMLSGSPHAAGGARPTRTSVAGLPSLTVRDTATGELRIAVPGAGALITGTYGDSPQDLERVLNAITKAPDGGGTERPERDGEHRLPGIGPTLAEGGTERQGGPGEPTQAGTERRDHPARDNRAPVRSGTERGDEDDEAHPWVSGRGFDTCAAPSLAAMRAWRKDFVAANIYIGGPARACPDGRLSRRWVSAVRAMGWRLIPTYVGPQAPCTSSRPRFSAGSAAVAGQLSAVDAVDRAVALGLPPKSPIYLDLEAYDRRSRSCRRAVLRFLDSWTRGLRALEYTSGVYSSVASGIRDLGEASGISKPTAIWFAHWDRKAGVRDDRYVSDDWWPGHRRIKQYRGDHVEKHGGVKLKIDSDAVDGYVH